VQQGKYSLNFYFFFLTCGLQIFESTFERRIIFDFSEVMFAMEQFEQVSKRLSLEYFF
jgi:hypothetical protein